jgi:hypothetical protein
MNEDTAHSLYTTNDRGVNEVARREIPRHIYWDRRGLALSGRGPRPLLARGDWLSHGARLSGDLAQDARTMALQHRTLTKGLPHRSDHGSQYAATRYQQLLTTYGLTLNMSRRGNYWDNACVESFFGTLTRELVYHRQYLARDEATPDIVEYIEVFYNRRPFPGRVRGKDGCGLTECPRDCKKVSSSNHHERMAEHDQDESERSKEGQRSD